MSRKPMIAVIVVGLAFSGMVLAAESDAKKAEAARAKPLLRCDQLADKAQMECLSKARERVLEARRKRESAGETRDEQRKTAGPQDAKEQPKKGSQ